MMARITQMVPASVRAQLSARELQARVEFAENLNARAAGCGNTTLAGCYTQVAKAALAALPRSELHQKVLDLRVKAAVLGPGAPGADTLLRQADALEAANPQPPLPAAVRKSANVPALTALYDCDGQIFGAAEAEDIIPALDPDVIMKAARSGMVATHDPATGKAVGFVDPDAITPVTDYGGVAKARAGRRHAGH